MSRDGEEKSTVYISNYEKWLSSDMLSDEEKHELSVLEDNPKEIENRFSSYLSLLTSFDISTAPRN